MNFWWRRAVLPSQVCWIHGVLPIIISWALWRARCASRMEGVNFEWRVVLRLVKLNLRDV